MDMAPPWARFVGVGNATKRVHADGMRRVGAHLVRCESAGGDRCRGSVSVRTPDGGVCATLGAWTVPPGSSTVAV